MFGGDWFGLKAEAFARFFGTPTFLIAQTILVAVWIWANAVGLAQFDLFPFILLNLAFSTQAAYAAPVILLAQTRQADRDKANSIADAQHREELHLVNEERQQQMQKQSGLMIEMIQQNNALAERVQTLLTQNTADADCQDPRRADRSDDEGKSTLRSHSPVAKPQGQPSRTSSAFGDSNTWGSIPANEERMAPDQFGHLSSTVPEASAWAMMLLGCGPGLCGPFRLAQDHLRRGLS